MSRNGPWIPSDDFLADLPRLMQVASLPGLAIATVEEGSVVWTRAVGVTNAETRAPVGDDTMFQVASLSKPAFAYAVLKLADEGLIDLDLPLAQYRRPSYLSDHPYVDLITARDVLRHSTGLPNWRDCPQERLVPAFKPGTGWRYSGEGFFWLQLVVEHVMGKGLDSVMRSRLFGPAKMPLSTFGWDAEQARLSAYGHKGPGDEEGKVDLQSKRETGGRFLDFATEWGKPISTWSSEDVLRALREAQALSGNTAKAPIHYDELPINLVPNAASSLETTVSEYARFMTLMMDRPRRASWEISEASRRAYSMHSIRVIVPSLNHCARTTSNSIMIKAGLLHQEAPLWKPSRKNGVTQTTRQDGNLWTGAWRSIHWAISEP